MGAHGSKRSHPDELVPGTLRVVSLRMDYLPGDTHMAQLLAKPEKAYISRYAVVTRIEPALQVLFMLGQVKAADADLLKAQLAAPVFDRLGEGADRK